MTILLVALAFAFAWSIGSHYTGACMGMPYALGAISARRALLLMAPLALISTVNGSQPLFVLIYGVLLTLYWPHYARERLGRAIVLQKVAATTLMVVGASLLTLW